MANIKSELKRVEVRARNNARNSANKTEARNVIKKAKAALEAKNKEEASQAVSLAMSLLDKLAQDGAMSTNSVNRKKANLQKALAALN